MFEWISEINWIMIFAVTAGVVLGTEIQRRKMKRSGDIFTFLPPSTHRLLNFVIGLCGAFFYQAARIAVCMPTEFHVWMLIFTTSAAFIVFATHIGLEFKFAKRALKASEDGTKGAAMRGKA